MSVTRKSINFANITILGNFNPVILRHDFLTDECGFEFGPPRKVSPPNVPMVTEIQYERFKWFMDFDRMIVEERDLSELIPFRCAVFAQKYLEVLPHTPVRAAGANVNADFQVADLAVLWGNLTSAEGAMRIVERIDTDSLEVVPRYVISGEERRVQEVQISYFLSTGPKVSLVVSHVEACIVRTHFNYEVTGPTPGPTMVGLINQNHLAILEEFQRLIELVSTEES